MTHSANSTDDVIKMENSTEQKSVERAAKLAPKHLYEVIRRDGEEELDRTKRALIWSGIAAGIMISFSVVGEAIFRTYLPQADYSYLVENLGYSLGFLLVILGRMQLFTENTITTVLPAMHDPSIKMLLRVARLWLIVLAANVVGAFAVAILFVFTPALPPELTPAMLELSRHATGFPTGEAFFRAIPAGVLVAAIVWMLPQANGGAFMVITVFTWLIAAGDFTHIIAGSVEMAYLMVQGLLPLGQALTQFFLPVLAGNIVGGTVIFSLMAYGQVKDEMVAHND
ncbi:formate/nitrite transporter family protein [Nereida sp. MMG025]|uniref:formate/nitrite transporter family protein n=1 Tax=Nereida sp. MMG025 TaxID=2909981 RepID=UPI001F299DAA|nr:formate/nitrite transporter family protein [Nereida sp. MMG025]MCF6445842.1 formate/nitrite transporter family protein [Nereida sp. MMG025]